MPEITIPSFVITGLQLLLAFAGAFLIALWLSLIVWTWRDARRRSRDIFAVLLATLMVAIFGPLGLLLYFLLRPPVTLAELYERSLEEEALLQDLEDKPRCPGCSRPVKEAWILCPDCHTTLQNVCVHCGNNLHLAWTICPFCGTPATVAHSHPPTDHGQPDVSQDLTVTQKMQPTTETQPQPEPEPEPEPVIELEPEPFTVEPSAPTVAYKLATTPPTVGPEMDDHPIPTPPT
ncbi:MAG: zinc ribbon domain-containing protein, partial [Chloroflexi bacterium]